MGIFVGVSLAAGALNYLFQIAASRLLTLPEFAQFSAWFARLAMLFMVPLALQYGANFTPLNRRTRRPALCLINICLVLLALTWNRPGSELSAGQALYILVAASFVGFLSGQAQIGLHLRALAFSGFALAGLKLIWLTTGQVPALDRFATALFFSNLPVVWFLTARLWAHAEISIPSGPGVPRRLVSILILSAAAATFPQVDLALLNLTQNADDYARFVLASLFYKAIYFVALAYLQWLFPHQVRGQAPRAPARYAYLFAGFGILGGALLALVGPTLGRHILGWTQEPPPLWIFLGGLNIGLLTWIYVRLQGQCARGDVGASGWIVFLLGLEAGLQYSLCLGVSAYLTLALVCQVGLVLGLSRTPFNSQFETPMNEHAPEPKT